MINLTVTAASGDDFDLLAELNRQLIEDEKHDNPMNTEQLKERMKLLLEGEYRAYLFTESGEVKGYALVHHGRNPLYLRQFFICRNSRRQGYGRAAFPTLAAFLGTSRLDIDVLYWNERARSFWKSLGFKERSIHMRLEP